MENINIHGPGSMDFWAEPLKGNNKETVSVSVSQSEASPLKVDYDFHDRRYRLSVAVTDYVYPSFEDLASVKKMLENMIVTIDSVNFIEATARMCHEMNRFVQLTNPSEEANKPWDHYDDDFKEITREGVRNALSGGKTPEQQHEAWLKAKAADGWVYGPYKDFEKKTHPCMVRYDDLDVVDQMKDQMFLTVVKEMKRLYGLV